MNNMCSLAGCISVFTQYVSQSSKLVLVRYSALNINTVFMCNHRPTKGFRMIINTQNNKQIVTKYITNIKQINIIVSIVQRKFKQ
jgi:hypothetical protein